MSSFGQNLKRIRQARKMSQDEFAALLGTSKQVISRYENDLRSPKVSVVADYAEKLGVSIGDLSGAGRSLPSNVFPAYQLRMRRVPILGDTAAGQPIVANREYDEFVEIPDDGRHHYDAALRVIGDSMTPVYHMGDLAFIRYQDDVLDGQVAAICLDDEVTLKRIYHIPGGVQLLSNNPEYPPMIYTGDDYNNIHLVGRAIGVLHFDD